MVFGSASPTPQPIEEKGAGFLYEKVAVKKQLNILKHHGR